MRILPRFLIAAALVAPALALAQASASVQLGVNLPVVLPPMVVVQPGVQVISDVDEEIFFSGGWYWYRQDGYWYRSHSPRHGWRVVPMERVPRRLVGIPPGQYRRWHGPPPRATPARFRPAPARYAPPAPASVRGAAWGAGPARPIPTRGHGHGEGDGRRHRD